MDSTKFLREKRMTVFEEKLAGRDAVLDAAVQWIRRPHVKGPKS
jgi:hypothetical protein